MIRYAACRRSFLPADLFHSVFGLSKFWSKFGTAFPSSDRVHKMSPSVYSSQSVFTKIRSRKVTCCAEFILSLRGSFFFTLEKSSMTKRHLNDTQHFTPNPQQRPTLSSRPMISVEIGLLRRGGKSDDLSL